MLCIINLGIKEKQYISITGTRKKFIQAYKFTRETFKNL